MAVHDDDARRLAAFLHVYARLQELPNYDWDTELEPIHSSYDNWHFFGYLKPDKPKRNSIATHNRISPVHTLSSPAAPQSPVSASASSSSRPHLARSHKSTDSALVSSSGSSHAPHKAHRGKPVVCRVSTHTLRLEREFQLSKRIIAQSDPGCTHFGRPVEFLRLPPKPGNSEPLVASVFESPGYNRLCDLVSFGTNAYRVVKKHDGWHVAAFDPKDRVPLLTFLDFAVGATECLEIMHHGHEIVHGELRGDAYYLGENGKVVMINFGVGARSFEGGLSSAGWSALSKEAGIELKLSYIAPEQTGRLPAEPDSRTDIYSLGILFYSMLCGGPPFQGNTPLEVMGNVLNKRIQPVSSKRIDIPDALSAVIGKMTMKNIGERYHSTSGLKHDLASIRELLSEGDTKGLASFQVGSKDISCFFNLPLKQIGRDKERKAITGKIEAVSAQRRQTHQLDRHVMNSLSSSSSFSDLRMEGNHLDDIMSDSTSSRSGTVYPEKRTQDTGTQSSEAPSGDVGHEVRPPPVSRFSGKSRPSNNSINSASSISRSSQSEASIYRKTKGSSRLNRRTRCEVVAIGGSAGVGKSCLIQSIQASARSYGYFAGARFDLAKKVPFDPVLKLMSSIFRQIFSEADVTTEFHTALVTFLKDTGVWGVLHSYLDLPEWLLVDKTTTQVSQQDSEKHESRRGSSSSPVVHPGQNGHTAEAWLKNGGASTSSRFMNIFIEVLRLLATHKLCIWSLEDIQYADTESADLIQRIVEAKIPLVLILTFREEDSLAPELRSLLPSATRIQLEPFTEAQTAEYVAETLHRDLDYILPLVAVIQEKSRGNIFNIREILTTCYRKHCVYYGWRENAWLYDLDKLFATFESSEYGSSVNNDFISKRIQDVPINTRKLLAWCSLLTGTLHFSLVRRLLTTKYAPEDALGLPLLDTSDDALAALNGALSGYILMPTDDEDKFRFSHDRYLGATSDLTNHFWDTKLMHYIITKTLIDGEAFSEDGPKGLYKRSRHICLAVDLLKSKEAKREVYRDVLYQAAETAVESGARSTGIFYYAHCLLLLQDDPWNESNPDVSYQETLRLFMRAAECYFHQSLLDEALSLIRTILQKSKDVQDMAGAFVLQSRVFAIRGDNFGAFKSLQDCLNLLGMQLEKTSWDELDTEFRELCVLLQNMDKEELLSRPLTTDRILLTTGPIFIELSSAAFWSNSLQFYQAALKIVRLHLHRGTVPQVAVGYVYLGAIAGGRFNMIGEFALECGEIARRLFDMYPDDHYTVGRGLTLQALFIGHLGTHIAKLFPDLNAAMEAGTMASDRILTLLNLGVCALVKQAASNDVVELEAWIEEAPFEFKEWRRDLRGGVLLTGARQYARALQGKTGTHEASLIFTDAEFDNAEYISFLETQAGNPKRPKTFYLSYQLPALVLYGFNEAAIKLGETLLPTVEGLWCQRLVYADYYYLSLAYLALLREDPNNLERQRYLDFVQQTIMRLSACCVVTDVNYRGWIFLLQALQAEITADPDTAMRRFEQAMDHHEVHSFTIDESYTFECYASFLIQKQAIRPARHLLRDAISTYRRMSAYGKADHLTTKFEWLLRGTSSLGTIDVEVQTTIIDTGNTQLRLEENEDRETQLHGAAATTSDRTNDWIKPKPLTANKTGPEGPLGNSFSVAVGLDMLDLSSILESQQILSSELEVDKLMSKMAEIIIESTGGSLCGIVVEDHQIDWSIACVATTDDIEGGYPVGVTSFPGGQPLDTVDDVVARQIITYMLRFRETVFVQNLLEDDRFSNVSKSYLKRNPHGKAVIGIPIIHSDNLIGAIYVEGASGSFTERNTNVLRLLVNQISISLANALLFKKVEKVSASNQAMLEMQKRALAQARAAELKAKEAEAEAVRNMKLKEEAARAKSLFLANVSHELRTPLNGVIGMSELLKASTLSGEQAGYADSIRVCADTLLSIINDLLDYSKLEAGKMNVIFVPLSLSETITEVVRALAYTNAERGLKTIEQLELKPDLLVMGDPVRLHQVLMNLISNSYKFTPKGSVTVRAVVEKESEDWIDVTCSVIDTGIGIPDEAKKNLFLPFSQIESSSSRSYGGTGLGLSICKALIENVMNGKIWLESTPGVGTTVSFSLRFQRVRDSAAATRQLASREVDPMAKFRQMDNGHEQLDSCIDLSTIPREELRVCIAEDNLINQRIAISFVQKFGFKCEAYLDGYKTIEALEKASKEGNPFHVVLMDVQMPHCDGYKATQLIRKHPDDNIRNVLIIAMTASAIEGDREKCLASGMNNYLAKPVKPNTLKALLESYLAQDHGDEPDVPERAKSSIKDRAVKSDEKENNKKPGYGESKDKEQKQHDSLRSPAPGETKSTLTSETVKGQADHGSAASSPTSTSSA